eukprot:TRINITY_DN17511_c1_g1_i1.p1 TRINITY_DN17511_c1_g1~~TRINITY_DN17511_c1_g1_i1.p1  ORF type:complete len:284 (-),score=53.71 TRINITY_DN17511_c1_g1_i1:104-904(-)
MEFLAQYIDFSAHNSLAAILRWCDTSIALSLTALDDSSVRAELKQDWEKAAVMRFTKAEMLVTGEKWESVFAGSDAGDKIGIHVSVSSSLIRLGKTSWTIQSEVSLRDGLKLGRAEIVMVQLDVLTLTKPVPLRHESHLRCILKDGCKSVEVPSVCGKPLDAFVWQTQVRPSDCDLLGHMNNVCYGVLMEDARRIAAQKKVLSQGDADTRQVSIEYVDQAKSLEILDVAVWWDEAVLAFGLEVLASGRVCAKGVIATWPKRQEARL